MPNEINLEKLSKYWETKGLRMTWRRYRQIAKDGKVPEPQRGMVDALEALARLAAYYQSMAEGGDDASLTDERKRKTTAEADIAEMERDVMRGNLILRSEVVGELVSRVVVLKGDLLSLPRRLAKYPEAKDISYKYIMQLLKTYSRPSGVFRKAKEGKEHAKSKV